MFGLDIWGNGSSLGDIDPCEAPFRCISLNALCVEAHDGFLLLPRRLSGVSTILDDTRVEDGALAAGGGITLDGFDGDLRIETRDLTTGGDDHLWIRKC